MSGELYGVGEVQTITTKKTSPQKGQTTQTLSVRNDQERDIPQGTYIPGTPLPKKKSMQELRADIMQTAGTTTVAEAITKERIAAGDAEYFTMRPGMTMSDIAVSLRDTNNYPGKTKEFILDDICKENGIADPNKVAPGTKIKLPPPLANEETDAPMADPQDGDY